MGQLTWAIPNIETPNLFYFIFEICCQFFHAYLKRRTLLDLLFADARVDVKSLHVPWINRSPGSLTAGGQRTAVNGQQTMDWRQAAAKSLVLACCFALFVCR